VVNDSLAIHVIERFVRVWQGFGVADTHRSIEPEDLEPTPGEIDCALRQIAGAHICLEPCELVDPESYPATDIEDLCVRDDITREDRVQSAGVVVQSDPFVILEEAPLTERMRADAREERMFVPEALDVLNVCGLACVACVRNPSS
jgi:hypothetical protein